MKIERQWVWLFLLGVLSNGLLFGVYMWFGAFLLLVTPLYSLYLFLNEGVNSIKKIGSTLSFIGGATCGWVAIFVFWL
jgi:hypothetical protein